MSSLPIDFVKRIQQDAFYPPQLLAALDTQAPTSVRLHPRRKQQLQLDQRVAWNQDGFYLSERPSFTYDPFFHAGSYYPQEAGSMFLIQALSALKLPEDPVILDLSAAPGGKSTLIAAFLKQRGILIANEIIRSRAYILAENLSKWGYSNTFVCNQSPEELGVLQAKIDVLVVDAPCSGEGMFRKDVAARAEWTTAAAANCALRQEDILENTWPLIKENGFLIYSTCTFNPQENEALLKNFMEFHDAQVLQPTRFEGMQADRESIGNYFFPGQIQSEGFYIAILQKKSPEKTKGKTKAKPTNQQQKQDQRQGDQISKTLPLTANLAHEFWTENEQLFATTQFAHHFFEQLPALKWLKKGIHIAQLFKKSWAPAYDMVYTLDLNWELPKFEVEREQALQILHGESQMCDLPAGHYLITYKGERIAMVKQLGQRFNNLHPTEWRIRHLPKH
ncbi:MAG: methyltransferase RsmF C-terminal domain-like protein [Flavobacteriales bacterium]